MTDHDAAAGRSELLIALRGYLGPTPSTIADAGRTAWTWRTVDAERAELTMDTAVDDHRLVGVRSGPISRDLTFEGTTTTVDVQVIGGSGTGPVTLRGLVSHGAGVIEIRGPHVDVRAESDELGRFEVADVAGGKPVRIRFAADERPPLETGWLTL